MKKFKYCPICGEGKLTKKIIDETFTYKGQSITIPNYIIYECDSCGEAIVDSRTLKIAGKKLTAFKRKVEGLLTPEEIRKIRKKFGFSQELMSELLGGGKKAFARYETGELCQSRAMDNLLRIIDAYPFTISILLENKAKEIDIKENPVVSLEFKKAYKTVIKYRHINHVTDYYGTEAVNAG